MTNYKLTLPNDFDDYAWEVETKGWFVAIAEFDGKRYEISFHDQSRLIQTITDELKSEHMFYESNLLVLRSVNRSMMEKAVMLIASTERYKEMVPE